MNLIEQIMKKVHELRMHGINPKCIFISSLTLREFLLSNESMLYRTSQISYKLATVENQMMGIRFYEVREDNVLEVMPDIESFL